MINRILQTLIFIAFAFTSNAQHERCGVTHEDQKSMISFVEAFNKNALDFNYVRSVDPVYIPIRFHNVAKTDGTGRMKAKFILDQMDVLITDYKKMGIYLYIDEYSFSYLNNNNIYLNAGSFESTVVGNKDDDAVNIFIAENADTPGGAGTTLGFYSPSGDYIIIRINDVRNATSSLSHELGHFFSLPHTFFGWEGVFDIYNWTNGWNVNAFNGQMNLTNAPGSGVAVEVMNGSNCTTAADRICDTPVDYNFGFGAEACDWNKTLLDINGDLIEPMEDNFMGYFLSCNSYQFTQGQEDVIKANFNSNGRSHLRKDYIPDTTHITSNHEILVPLQGEMLDQYDEVLLDWSDAVGASHYLVSISNADENYEIIVEGSEYLATELAEQKFYFWEVQPFNDGFTGTTSKSSFFTTGQNSVATEDSKILNNVTVYPNPTQIGQYLNVNIQLEKSVSIDIDIVDITGKVIFQKSNQLHQGSNTINITTVDMNTGLYFLKIKTDDGFIYKKIVMK
ncbi:MAG: T9SS type A sorting domain-containing protein [Saprospiraceae bacterium]